MNEKQTCKGKKMTRKNKARAWRNNKKQEHGEKIKPRR
jgi:hypothetical protein